MSTRWDDFFFLHLRKFVLGGVVLLGFVAYSLFGGGDGTGPENSVSGVITSGGKPVVFGTVTAIASDNSIHTTQIRPDGSYEFRGLPPGPVQLAVSSPNPRPTLGPATPTPAPNPGGTQTPNPKAPPGKTADNKNEPKIPNNLKTMAASSTTAPPIPVSGASIPQHQQWFPINGKYANPSTSGITGVVGSGKVDVKLD